MAAAFNCPQCGGPINLEPQPGEETVECPYCHDTVIIPKSMRVPLPKKQRSTPQPKPSPTTSNKMLRRGIIIGASVVVVACIIFTIVVNLTDTGNTSSSDVTSGTSAPVSLSVSDSSTATVEAKATNDALVPILQMEQSWPASFSDEFTDNNHAWDIGDVRDSYITGNRSISGGVYTWTITSVQSSINFSFPTMTDQQDFYASVDVNLINMPDDPNADAGLLLRHNSNDESYYYYSINNQGQYYFGWYDGSNWYDLIPETDSSAIHLNQTNRMTVGVQGSQFIFSINGQMVDHFIDENLKSGTIGLALNLPQAGQKATVAFSHFSILSTTPSQ